MVEGDIEASAYIDKSGTARASLELTVTTLKMLGSKADNEAAGDGHQGAAQRPDAMSNEDAAKAFDDGDAPF